MGKSLSSIIASWGEANLTKYGKGTNIDPDDRAVAFSVLFDEAVAQGYAREDIEQKTKAILSFCIPTLKTTKTKKTIRTDKFFFPVLKTYIEVLDLKFPHTPSGLEFEKTFDYIFRYYRLESLIKRKEQEIIERKDSVLEDDDISEFKKSKDESIDDTLSVDRVSEKEKKRLQESLIESQIKKELIDPEKAIGELYILSKEEIEENFIPDLDPEVQKLLGLNDKGEIA